MIQGYFLLTLLNMSEGTLYAYYTRAIGHDERWTYRYPAGWVMNSTGAIKTNKRTNINDPKLFVQDEFHTGPTHINLNITKNILVTIHS